MNRSYWPYKTLHGWIVGVSAVDTDDCPTFLASERAAEEWAEKLNAMAVGEAQGAVEALREIVAYFERGDLDMETSAQLMYEQARAALDASREQPAC